MNQYINMSTEAQELLDAEQAADRLGVSRATLYAYVSRGKVRSMPGPGRTRWYAAEDIERVKAAAEARRGHGPVAKSALLWGEPVLSTGLVELTKDGPRYRGRSALELAASGVGFESVAELLWSGKLPEQRPRWRERPQRSGVKGLPRVHTPFTAMSLQLARLALTDPGRFLLSERGDIARGRRIVMALVEQLAAERGVRTRRRVRRAATVAEGLLLALGGRVDAGTLGAVDQALVLVLDHELNSSTFAARIAASTGADLYACLMAALCTLSGPRHGGATARIEALLSEVGSPRRARAVLLARRRRGEAIPGFGHPLYAAGDPRARPLLNYAEQASERVEVRTLSAILRAMQRARQPAPTIDFGLVALCTALGLTKGSAAALFAVGRTAGWVAHVLEQRRQGVQLRPRASYVRDLSQPPGGG